MAKKDDKLQVLAPQPVADERTPLLGEPDDNQAIEAQAEQEQREHDVGAIPLAEEPSTKMLVLTMSSLWLCAFFAAMDQTIVSVLAAPISSSFHSGELYSWIASGYLIGNAAFQPLSGRLRLVCRARIFIPRMYSRNVSVTFMVDARAWCLRPSSSR